MTIKDVKTTVFSSFGTHALLLGSGLIAVGVATIILFAPGDFYAGYDIDISSNVSLVNELKAPAGVLLIAGLLMLVGVFRAQATVLSLTTATTIYLSYGLSRFMSMAIDGVPHSGLVGAAVLETGIGVICFLDLTRYRKTGFERRNSAGRAWYATTDEDAA